jgi:hypothetical protein
MSGNTKKKTLIECSQHILGSCYKPRSDVYCLSFKLIVMSSCRLCVFGTTYCVIV